MYPSRCRSRELHDLRYFPRAPRTIRLKRGSSGFGFSIIGGENGDGIFVSFVVAGGPADMTSELRRGDRIVAVNDVSLVKASHEQAAAALKNAGEAAEIVAQYNPELYNALEAKIYEQLEKLPNIPEGQLKTTQNKTFHVRALFDYDPTKDSDLPCHGLAFKYGDVLHLTNATDEEWWRATMALPGSADVTGVIPSKQRVERKERSRIRSVRFRLAAGQISAGDGGSSLGSVCETNKRSPLDLLRLKKEKRKQLSIVADDALELVPSYEEVLPLQLRHARPVILLGHLKDNLCDRLIKEYPESFCALSRIDSVGAAFGHSEEAVMNWRQEVPTGCVPRLHSNQNADGFDGVDAAVVRRAAASGRHCILTTSARVIGRLQASGFYPISVLVRPQSVVQILDGNHGMSVFQAKDEYESCVLLEREFSKQFTAIVEGDTVDYIYQSVKDVIETHSGSVVWVPAVTQATGASAADDTKRKDKFYRNASARHATVDASA